MVSLQGAAAGITAWGEVYNMAGERVASLSGTGAYMSWIISPNMASGTYLLHISARSASGALRTANVKAAIVR
jgi:hypothetical protein